MAEQQSLTTEKRKEILDRAVAKYVKNGYRVISQTDTTAQLVKPKRFGCAWMIVSLFSLGIAIIFYLIQKEQSIYLEVDLNGRLRRIRRKQ